MGGKKTSKKVKRDKMVPTPIESWKIPDNITAAKETFLHTQIPSTSEIGKVCTLFFVTLIGYYPKFISI